jgi:hypothetical protein
MQYQTYWHTDRTEDDITDLTEGSWSALGPFLDQIDAEQLARDIARFGYHARICGPEGTVYVRAERCLAETTCIAYRARNRYSASDWELLADSGHIDDVRDIAEECTYVTGFPTKVVMETIYRPF